MDSAASLEDHDGQREEHGQSGSSKVIDFGINGKRACDFLLVINSNLALFRRYFDSKAKNRHFSLPPLT